MKYIIILITIFSVYSCSHNKYRKAEKLQDCEYIYDTDTIYYNSNDSTLTLKGIKINNECFDGCKYNIIYKDIEIKFDNLGGTGKIKSITSRVFYHWKTKEVYMSVSNITNEPEVPSYFGIYNWCYTLNEYISATKEHRAL